MPSALKSETARINGAKSRGPKTPQGRARSSMNALCHGLNAKTLILPHEDRNLFAEIWKDYFDLLKPANQMEIDLVSDIVAARWRLRRMERYETVMLDEEIDTLGPEFKKFDEDKRAAIAFSALANTKGYDTVLRSDIHLTRTYHKALDNFHRLRAGKGMKKLSLLQNEPKTPNLSPMDSTRNVKPISTEPKEARA
jgi:hypothetical protein